MKSAARIFSLVGSALVVGVLAATPAAAQDAGTASVVIVHGLRGFTADLYLDGKLLINTFQPERSTDPLPVPAGPHLVEIREAGAPADAPPALTANIDLVAGTRYDAVAHLNEGGAPTVTLFVDDVSAVPPGQARVAVRQTAAAPPIDIRYDQALAATGVANGTSSDAVLPAGAYDLTVNTSGAAAPLTPTGAVTLPEGTATFMYLIGSAEGQTLDWLAVQATGLQSCRPRSPPVTEA